MNEFFSFYKIKGKEAFMKLNEDKLESRQPGVGMLNASVPGRLK